MTTGRGGGTSVTAGGPARHIPVLGRPMLDMLAPRAGGLYLDATFGAGGYTRMILEAADCSVIALDRDRTAIAGGMALVDAMGGRLTLVEEQFSRLAEVCAAQGVAALDGIVMDIGVSSMQLDQAARGFSFRFDGPLDMRMGHDGLSAADVVAQASEADLARIIYVLGEERHSRRIARAIVAARREAQIVSTKMLADVVASVMRVRPNDIHPATRTFQALRIFVNEELDELAAALTGAEHMLKPGGRLVVVSFHSLEDRIVKTFMTERAAQGGGSRHAPEIVRAAPSFSLLTRKPIVADEFELAHNPRARSARLRAAERTGASTHGAADTLLPPLPSVRDIMRGG